MIEQMIATVQIYIHHRKGVEVQIAIRNATDIIKLQKAYNIASAWLTENNFKTI
jgi:predicted glycosyltransferase